MRSAPLFTIASPMPVPGYSSALCSRSKTRKMRSWCSGRTPMPLPSTHSRAIARPPHAALRIELACAIHPKRAQQPRAILPMHGVEPATPAHRRGILARVRAPRSAHLRHRPVARERPDELPLRGEQRPVQAGRLVGWARRDLGVAAACRLGYGRVVVRHGHGHGVSPGNVWTSAGPRAALVRSPGTAGEWSAHGACQRM